MEMKNENLKEMILKLTQKDIDELMEKTEKEESTKTCAAFYRGTC